MTMWSSPPYVKQWTVQNVIVAAGTYLHNAYQRFPWTVPSHLGPVSAQMPLTPIQYYSGWRNKLWTGNGETGKMGCGQSAHFSLSSCSKLIGSPCSKHTSRRTPTRPQTYTRGRPRSETSATVCPTTSDSSPRMTCLLVGRDREDAHCVPPFLLILSDYYQGILSPNSQGLLQSRIVGTSMGDETMIGCR